MVNISKKKIWDERAIYEDIRIGKGSFRGPLTSSDSTESLAYLNTLVRYARRANGEAKLLSGMRARPNLLQNSIVKVSIARNYEKGQWRAHGRYLERVVAQGHEMGFDSQKDDCGLARTLAAWQKEGDQHVYKFIVSPEQGTKMDLKEHARDLVRRMEKDQGAVVEWCGIVHKNTEHPHVHICVRGQEKNGRTLVIDDEYMKRGMRQASREIATRELGFQRVNDILAARERSIQALRVTELDRLIDRFSRNPSRDFSKFLSVSHKTVEWEQMKERLEFLASRGLANKIENGYAPAKDFMAQLREHQKERDIAKSLADERKHMMDPDLKISDRTLKRDESVCGRVASIIYDEAKDRRYLLLETTKGEAIRIKMNTRLEKERDNVNLQRGDLIYLKAKEIEIEGKKMLACSFENYKDILTREKWKLFGEDIIRIDLSYHNQRDEFIDRTKTGHATNFQKQFMSVMEKRHQEIRHHIAYAQERKMDFDEMHRHFANSRGPQLSLQLER